MNWITSELFAYLKKNNLDIVNSPISPENFGKLISLIVSNEISGKIAKDVFDEMFISSKDPRIIIEEKGLTQITDIKKINLIIDQVLEINQDKLNEYKNGKTKLLGFFIGQIMKLSNGKINPKLANKVFAEKIKLFLKIINFRIIEEK